MSKSTSNNVIILIKEHNSTEWSVNIFRCHINGLYSEGTDPVNKFIGQAATLQPITGQVYLAVTEKIKLVCRRQPSDIIIQKHLCETV